MSVCFYFSASFGACGCVHLCPAWGTCACVRVRVSVSETFFRLSMYVGL